jgi:hypothetical protein
MAQRAAGSVRLLLALVSLLLCGAGLVAQTAFMVRDATDRLGARPTHELRTFLQAADRRIPAGASYAVTSDVRADNARYFLYPRQRVDVTFTRADLDRAGVRYVIETPDARPPALRGRQSWFRVLLDSPVGRLLEVTG